MVQPATDLSHGLSLLRLNGEPEPLLLSRPDPDRGRCLSCVQLIGSAADPPLWCVLLLWALAGAGGAYQLAAAAAFVQALRPATRARAFGLAQSGLYAVQGLGILAQSPKTAAC